MGFWGKKMLPQVFKWDDASREVICSAMDEANVLSASSDFIATTPTVLGSYCGWRE